MEDASSPPREAEPPPPLRPFPSLLLVIATSVLAIGAVVGIYVAVRPAEPSAAAQATEEQDGAELIDGHDYRILVAVARVRPTKPGGDVWDSGAKSNSAPDPFYEIWWQGNRVCKSQDVENALVAAWSNAALPELYKLLSDEKLSLETIAEGALVTARKGGAIRIRILDDDPFENDLIEELTVPMSELRVGELVRDGRQGLESVTLRVIPREGRQLQRLLR
jgi:hypothetical protein